ncbi:hypothetical protein [Nostoc sp. 'Lobaria pulmonaria (5183) cyanobiont']|nr:hypothetical protein [Nostoc sp. 'Lobaria pulmonaria (5183) cyanobiont']
MTQVWAIAYENGKSNISIFKLCDRLRSYNSSVSGLKFYFIL